MWQNFAMDIVIGLVLMYLILSLVCTVINEYIATKLALRATSLAAGLQELLDDPMLRHAFYDHGLIAGIRSALAHSSQTLLRAIVPFSRAPAPAAAPATAPAAASAPAAAPVAVTPPGADPSYISADTFVLALIGSLTGTHLAKDQPVPTFAEVQAAIQALPPSKIKSTLLTSLMTAHGDFDTFQHNMATWFDDAMERLSGSYKRRLKLISMIVGFVVAVIINADTFAVGYALWSNPTLRAQMVQVATETANRELQKTPGSPTGRDVENALRSANDTLRPMLPLGWPISRWLAQPDQSTAGQNASTQTSGPPTTWTTWLAMGLMKLAGWFVTALALSLGAPFWFDTLSKFVNIRGTGVKPERTAAQ